MNANSTPPRSYLTELVVSRLAVGAHVYAYEKPDGTAGGWDKEPGSYGAKFIPYSIITPHPAGDPSGSLADQGENWVLGYSLTTYGASGLQVERQSDKLRKLWSEMQRGKVSLGTENWGILKARSPRIGGVFANRSGTKPVWQQVDTVEIHVSKER